MENIDEGGLSGGGTPDMAFWENELEMPVLHWLERSEENPFMERWVSKLTGPQVSVLHSLLGLSPRESTRHKKDDLRNAMPSLRRFVPAGRFARSKSRVAVIDFAQGVLDPAIMELCQNGKGEFDAHALIFAIYDHDWMNLSKVFHLDKIHKSGFARMVLSKPLKQPSTDLGDFLSASSLAAHLERFDRTKNDERTSELKNVIPHNGRHLVFIRRAERHDLLLQRTTVVHGFTPEWIILDFQDGALRVNIASKSVSVPLEIANHIASAYFGQDAEYINDRECSYSKQIQRFLGLLGNDKAEEIKLVELVVGNGPLDGAPKIVVSQTEGSIAASVRHFEKAVGGILDDVSQIDRIKVLYREKRVPLKFEVDEENDDEFIVRYSDNILNEKERRSFEAFMSKTHGITILSTEKRHRR